VVIYKTKRCLLQIDGVTVDLVDVKKDRQCFGQTLVSARDRHSKHYRNVSKFEP